MPFKSISATRAQTLLSQRAKLLTDISKSLSGGPPINWTASDRAGYTAQLRGLGFNLVTKGQARALGLEIPPSTAPMGRGEFGPPLSQFLELYILEIHGTELEERPPPEAIESAPTTAKKPRRRRRKSGRGCPAKPGGSCAGAGARPQTRTYREGCQDEVANDSRSR